MIPNDFRAALTDWKMSQGEFARWLEVDERTVRRWAAEGPPKSVELLIGVMRRFGVTPYNAGY